MEGGKKMTEKYLPIRESVGYKNVRLAMLNVFNFELDNITIHEGDYVKTMGTNYTQKDINELTKLTTHNANSDTALLGYFEPNSVRSYEQIAYENGFTYFDAGPNGWRSMWDINKNLAYSVNDEFLISQVKQGKDFVLSSNPNQAAQILRETGKGQSYVNELAILQKNGYKFKKYGDFWKAVKK